MLVKYPDASTGPVSISFFLRDYNDEAIVADTALICDNTTAGGAVGKVDFFFPADREVSLSAIIRNTTPAGSSIASAGSVVEFRHNVDAPIQDKSIVGGKLADETLDATKLKDDSVTPPKLEKAFEWVDNAGTIQKDLTATESYMLAYKKNQNLDSSIATNEQKDQWVHARLSDMFELEHSSFIGTNPSTRRTNFGLGIRDGGIRQNHLRDPLDIGNFIGATVLSNGAVNDPTRIFPTDLDSGDWVTEAGTAPGITFKSSLAGFTIPRGRPAQLRTMTHFLVRIGKKSGAKAGGDTLRNLAIDPKTSGGNLEGDIMNEIMVPVMNTYAPPVPSPTNVSGTTRGTGDEHSFYNLGTSSFTVGIRITAKANGEKEVDVIDNSVPAIAANTWVSFHAVRGIGG